MMRPNPFSTRFVRPGEIPFVFPPGSSLEQLLEECRLARAQKAILGPHGSGKSTLLETLSGHWPEVGLTEQRVRLTASKRRVSFPWRHLDEASILVIDGFEQLWRWQQWRIRWRCWQKGTRLLVTCHAECGLPVALRTEPSWALAWELAADRLGGEATAYEDELRGIWQQHPGDVREFFFRLYHFCESQGICRSGGDLPMP